MYELPVSSDEYRLQEAKRLLLEALQYVRPHQDPFETDEGYAAYALRRQIQEFVNG